LRRVASHPSDLCCTFTPAQQATSLKARAKIAELGECFIRNGSVVLTHGNSRVVLALLKRAAAEGKHFSVVVRATIEMHRMHSS
jgi:translation initiation factor 2B subunit (eIF-2B alpha/beta/delta family)